MKTRVLYKNGCYIPQVRHMLNPFWYSFTDAVYDREFEELDCYNTDLDPYDIAEECAIRALNNPHDFVGMVHHKSWRQRLLGDFVGPTGNQGQPGPQGSRGDRGDKCGALDLQCPNCRKFISDHPRQPVVFEIQNGNHFEHTCAKCEHSELWTIVEGLPIPNSMLKEARDAAAGGRKAT